MVEVEKKTKAETGNGNVLKGEEGVASSSASQDLKSDYYDHKILVVGELCGGTKYFNENAMRGLYRMLKEKQPEEFPNYIIFNGGILPEIPKYATKGPADKLHIIRHGINNVDDAVIFIKPSLERLISLIGQKGTLTEVIYMLGAEDKANIKNRNYDRIISSYNNNFRNLIDLREAYIEKIETNTIFVETMEKSLNQYEKDNNAKNANDTELVKKIKRLKLKITQAKDQINDYETIVGLYETLQLTWMKENPSKVIQSANKVYEMLGEKSKWNEKLYKEHKKSINTSYQLLSQEFNKLDKNRYPEKYRNMEKQLKKLSNLMEAFGHKNIQNIKKEADLAASGNIVQEKGELFTRNLRASHEVAEIARKIANLEIISHIKDSFGRKYNITIIQDSDGTEEWQYPSVYGIVKKNDLGMLITNNPTNSSGLFNRNIKSMMEKTLNIPGPDSTSRINLVIGSHTTVARVSAVPLVDGGNGAFMVSAPPLADVKAIASLWKSGTKTPYTMAYENAGYKMSSGVWEICLSKNKKNNFTFHFSNELLMFSDKESMEQRQALALKLRDFEPVKIPVSRPVKAFEKEVEDSSNNIWLKHKLPSEWNDDTTNAFLIKSGINLRDKETIAKLRQALMGEAVESDKIKKAMIFVDKILPVSSEGEGGIEKVRINAASDTHIGGTGKGVISPQELLKAFISKTVDDPPNIILLLGDIVDPNYNHYANELDQETDYYSNIGEFTDFAMKRLPKTQLPVALERYLVRAKKQIYNQSDQLRVFMESASGLNRIPDDHKPKIGITAGNHFNKNHPERDDDEAKRLALAFNSSYKLVTASGGDYGIGVLNYGSHKFIMRHEMGTKTFNSLRLDKSVSGAFVGHIHTLMTEIIGNQFLATVPQSAYTNGYPTQIGIPTSDELRGFSKYEMLLRKDKMLSLSTEFVSQAQLENEGYLNVDDLDKLIDEFNKRYNPSKLGYIEMIRE